MPFHFCYKVSHIKKVDAIIIKIEVHVFIAAIMVNACSAMLDTIRKHWIANASRRFK
jgi:hypothetical protein